MDFFNCMDSKNEKTNPFIFKNAGIRKRKNGPKLAASTARLKVAIAEKEKKGSCPPKRSRRTFDPTLPDEWLKTRWDFAKFRGSN